MSKTPNADKILKHLNGSLLKFFTRFPPAPLANYKLGFGKTDSARANPFNFTIHPKTHKFHNPVYNRRRAKLLYQKAESFNCEDLLPLWKDGLPVISPDRRRNVMRSQLYWKGTKEQRNWPTRKAEIEKALENADITEATELKRDLSKIRKKNDKKKHEWY